MAARNPDRDLVRQTLEPFLAKVQPLDGPAYWAATNSFHGSVEELGANRVIELMARLIGQHLARARRDPYGHDRPTRGIHEEHRDIAKAIIAGQPTKASTADA